MNLSKVFTQTAITTPERKQEADADFAVVKQVQAGDVAAFDKLIVKYRERVFGVIYNLSANREDASDLSQETFIKAFQAINRFQGNCSFFTWLYKIAINTTLSHLRKNRMRSFFSLEKLNDEGGNAQVIDQLTDKRGADRDAYLRELQEKLNEALQKLSIPHRTVITLFEIDGLSHAEIAEVMDCSEGTVRSRLHYAKQFLQGELGKYLRS
ncbi:MAG TPA: sigma-70 family RNA polymerase sigma factor [Lacunisphaera sp.]|nr:sigma-70 family RNA polymerase sigma factor [Lacunisphaera sp.]